MYRVTTWLKVSDSTVTTYETGRVSAVNKARIFLDTFSTRFQRVGSLRKEGEIVFYEDREVAGKVTVQKLNQMGKYENLGG